MCLCCDRVDNDASDCLDIGCSYIRCVIQCEL